MSLRDSVSKVLEDLSSLKARIQLARDLEHLQVAEAEDVWFAAARIAADQGLFFQALWIARTHLSKEREILQLEDLARRYGVEKSFVSSLSTKKEPSSVLAALEDFPTEPEEQIALALRLGTASPKESPLAVEERPFIPIFSELPTLEFVMVASCIEKCTLHPSKLLLSQGEQEESIYLLTDGQVRISRQLPSGENVELAQVSAPALLGETSLLAQLPWRASVISVGSGIAWRLDKTLLRLLETYQPTLVSRLRNTARERLLQDVFESSSMFEDFMERERLIQSCNLQTYAPGAEVFSQGAPPPGLYILLHGDADIWIKDDSGNETCVRKLTEGDSFGELSLLLKEPTSASVRMPEGGILLHLSVAAFSKIRDSIPGIEQSLHLLHGQRLASNSNEQRVQMLVHSFALRSEELMEEIVPYLQKGFWTELRKQPFFLPGFLTAVVGLVLFFLLEATLYSQQVFFAYTYEFVLAMYLGGMALFAIRSLLAPSSPPPLALFGLLLTMLLYLVQLPLSGLAYVFRQPVIWNLSKSQNIVLAWLGQFVATGLLEELFKMLPVLLILLLAPTLSRWLSQRSLSLMLSTRALILVGSASGIGFTLMETLLEYVPRMHAKADLAMGVMLLMPRLITSICGHMAWSGLFAYFIALALQYKHGKLKLFLVGWVLSAFLHASWNVCGIFGIPILGTTVALASFALFAAQVFKARNQGEQASV